MEGTVKLNTGIGVDQAHRIGKCKKAADGAQAENGEGFEALMAQFFDFMKKADTTGDSLLRGIPQEMRAEIMDGLRFKLAPDRGKIAENGKGLRLTDGMQGRETAKGNEALRQTWIFQDRLQPGIEAHGQQLCAEEGIPVLKPASSKAEIPELKPASLMGKEAENPEMDRALKGVRAIVAEWIRNPEQASEQTSENGFLNSAKGQSVLNRLNEIQNREQGVGESLETADRKIPDKSTVPVKGILEENGGMKRPGEAKTERQGNEASVKTYAGEAIPNTGEVKVETVKTATPGISRPIGNLEEVGEKIEFGVNKVLENGESIMRVRLKPDELGHIEIRLALEDGTVKGRILVENEGIKEQLRHFLMDEKSGAAQNALRLKEIEVSLFQTHAGASEDYSHGAYDFQRDAQNSRFSKTFRDGGSHLQLTGENGKDAASGLDLFA